MDLDGLAVFVLGQGACAASKGAQAHRAPDDDAVPGDDAVALNGQAIQARRCDPAGPTAEATIVERRRGKPPHETLVATIRVRNPLARPIWFAYQVSDPLPGTVSTVDVQKVFGKYVWSFGDPPRVVAIRVAPRTDVTMNDVEYERFDFDSDFMLVLANAVRLDGRMAEDWIGKPGLVPAGDVDLEPPSHFVVERGFRGRARLGVDVLCTSLLEGPGIEQRTRER